jgi:hypothetical protein
MSQTTINNGDTGLVARTDLNSMFAEIYTFLNISSKYLAMFPLNGHIGTGVPRDFSANGISMYPMGGLAETSYWANQGELTIGAGSNLGLGCAAANLPLTSTATKNILIAGAVKKTAPGGDEPILGNTDLTVPGFQIVATSAGKLKVNYRDAANVNDTTTSFGIIADGSWRTFALFLNTANGRLDVYVDGGFDVSRQYRTAGTTIPASQDFGVGAVSGANQTTYACSLRGLHFMTFTSPPINMAELMLRCHASILAPLNNWIL